MDAKSTLRGSLLRAILHRMGDIGKASAVINSYFSPYNHKPTSTNVAVLEVGEPEQLIEIQVVAVAD